MKITEIALKEARLTWTLVVFVVLGGTIAFFGLPRFEDPKIPFRYALLTAIYPGASVERIESLVTARIEEAMSEIPEVEFINSVSRNNACAIVIKLKDRHDVLQPIWDRIRRKTEQIKTELPEGVRGPFLNDEYGEVFGIILTVTGKDVSEEEIGATANRLRGRLLRLEEVSKVIKLGEPEEVVFVEFDDAYLADLGFSARHLKSFLEAQNAIAPGGGIRQGDLRIPVEPVSDLRSVEEIENLSVTLPDEEDLYTLGELLDIRKAAPQPPVSLLRSSGSPGIGLGISLREGGNVIKLGQEVRELVTAFPEEVGDGIEFEFVAFEPDRVTSRVNGFFLNLIWSLVVIMLILMGFLGLRTGSVIATMMPLVILATLMVMYGLNVTINLVALAAFIVVLGIMVDNHIVISERILTLRERGQDAFSAATTATSELHAPLITATVTTIAGFLPIYLAESTSGEYVTPLFQVIALALICSTFFSFTITPALSVHAFKLHSRREGAPPESRWLRLYRSLLHSLLRRRFLVLAAVLLAFIGAVYSFRFVPTIFFPPSDRPIFTLELEFPSGTVIERTAEAAARIDRFTEEYRRTRSSNEPDILNWLSLIGRNAPRYVLNHRTREYSPEYAFFIYNVESTKVVPFFREKLESFTRKEFPEAQVRVRRIESGPAIGYPIRIHISGDEMEELSAIASEVKEFVGSIPGVYNVGDDWGQSVKKLLVEVDDEAAGMAGVTNGEVAFALQTLLTGIPASSLRSRDGVIPILIKSSVAGEDEIQRIKDVNVHSSLTGKSVPLGEVTRIREVHAPSNIIRRNFLRTITVQADLDAEFNLNAVDDSIRHFIERNQERWGSGHQVQLGGEGTESERANRSILINLPWAGFLILLLLIRQTRSFRRTFIILSTIPMGFIGIVFGLLVTRVPFGFTTLVGMVSLTGIVVNNAIILMDRIRRNTDGGTMSETECIVEAALNRVRPILLTSLTTIGGILPILRGNPTWQGMAVSIIFGLLFSTVLVLFAVPVLYAFLFRIKFRDN